jgi:hypothetical protein
MVIPQKRDSNVDATSTFTGETAAGYSIARIESIPKID